MSDLAPIAPGIDQAARRLPFAVRERVSTALLLELAGYEPEEIAEWLDTTTRTLRRDREALRAAILDVMQEDGYTEHEIDVTLGLERSMSARAA